jgi:hypothetical protein
VRDGGGAVEQVADAMPAVRAHLYTCHTVHRKSVIQVFTESQPSRDPRTRKPENMETLRIAKGPQSAWPKVSGPRKQI